LEPRTDSHRIRPNDHQGRYRRDLPESRHGIRAARPSRERGSSGRCGNPLHKNNPKEFLRTLQPLGQISSAKDIAEAVFYLTEASQITGEVLHVDGGAHLGRW